MIKGNVCIKGIENMKVNCKYSIDDLEDNTIIATLNSTNYSNNPIDVFYMIFITDTGKNYRFYEKDIINFEYGILNVTKIK